MTPDLTPEERVVEHALRTLMEHFEAVQIFATRQKEGGDDKTHYLSRGAGNWFARYGHVKAWVIKEDETLRREAIKEQEDQDD